MLLPVRCSNCSARDGTPPALSSFETRSTRHIGKKRSDNPMKGSSCATAHTQSSKAFRSRARKNTPAALISSSTPQHFSRGLCRTSMTAAPDLIPLGSTDFFVRFDLGSAIFFSLCSIRDQLSHKLSYTLYQVGSVSKLFNLRDKGRAYDSRVSVAPRFGNLF